MIDYTGWKITPEVISQRTDLRHIPVCSIDPPGCKDIDDALHCVRLPNGRIEAGVHIADVTYFVHPDTAIDKEAAHRSTSTYLGNGDKYSIEAIIVASYSMHPSHYCMLAIYFMSSRSKTGHVAWSADNPIVFLEIQ